jgi:hypothetical protein
MKVAYENRNARAGSFEDLYRIGAILYAVDVKPYTIDLVDAHRLGRVLGDEFGLAAKL